MQNADGSDSERVRMFQKQRSNQYLSTNDFRHFVLQPHTGSSYAKIKVNPAEVQSPNTFSRLQSKVQPSRQKAANELLEITQQQLDYPLHSSIHSLQECDSLLASQFLHFTVFLQSEMTKEQYTDILLFRKARQLLLKRSFYDYSKESPNITLESVHIAVYVSVAMKSELILRAKHTQSEAKQSTFCHMVVGCWFLQTFHSSQGTELQGNSSHCSTLHRFFFSLLDFTH